MHLEHLDLLAAHCWYMPDWGLYEEEEWQCMRHRNSSLEGSPRRCHSSRMGGLGNWARRGGWGRSWLLIYRYIECGQPYGGGSRAGKRGLSIGCL